MDALRNCEINKMKIYQGMSVLSGVIVVIAVILLHGGFQFSMDHATDLAPHLEKLQTQLDWGQWLLLSGVVTGLIFTRLACKAKEAERNQEDVEEGEQLP